MYPPLSGLFDSRPVTCVPTATIEGWKSDPGRYFVRVPIVFSFFPPLFFPPTRLKERSTFRFSFPFLSFSSFVPCFARETFEIHRLLSMKIDFELCANYSFFFVKSLRNLRKDSSNRSSILRIFGYRNITKIFSDFQSRKFVEKCFFYGIVKGWLPNRAIQ